jgi:hypothetical protein
MKVKFLLGALLSVATALFGQGTVNFANNSATRITNVLTLMPIPAGTFFSAALYYGPDGMTDDINLIQIGASAIIGPPAGIILGGTRTTPANTAPGGFAVFQIRVWETAFGSTYEEAAFNPNPIGGRLALVGKSNCVRVETGNPFLLPPTPPGLLTSAGLQGFFVGPDVPPFNVACPIPEPGPIWLLFLSGVGALFLRCRRR